MLNNCNSFYCNKKNILKNMRYKNKVFFDKL